MLDTIKVDIKTLINKYIFSIFILVLVMIVGVLEIEGNK